MKQKNTFEIKYLIGNRWIDFALMGGVAILIWILFISLSIDAKQNLTRLGLIATLSFYLAYFINYPHFMVSYKLAYLQGEHFIRSHFFQLIIVPAILSILFLFSIFFWNLKINDSTLILYANSIFSVLGINNFFGKYIYLGPEVLGNLVQLMYFTVGWHYSKQAFGCMMVYARFDKYILSTWQRNIIRYGLLSSWWYTWINSNASVGTYDFYELHIHRLGLPHVFLDLTKSITICFNIFILLVLIYNYIKNNKKPTLNFLVPWIALLIWHYPELGEAQYFYLIALFHSLQYFPFVMKIEKTRILQYDSLNKKVFLKRSVFIYILLILAGLSAFTLMPNSLDTITHAVDRLKISYFLISFITFINIHHYFIDNILWRFKNTEMQKLLFEEH